MNPNFKKPKVYNAFGFFVTDKLNIKKPRKTGVAILYKSSAYFFVFLLEAFFTEVLLEQALLLDFVEQEDLLEQLILLDSC